MAKNRKNTIQNAKKVIKMSTVTVFTQSLGYNVIFCVFEKGANNILFSIPLPPKGPPKDPPGVPPSRVLRSHDVGVYKLLLRGSRSPIWGYPRCSTCALPPCIGIHITTTGSSICRVCFSYFYSDQFKHSYVSSFIFVFRDSE